MSKSSIPDIEFVRLEDIKSDRFLELMNHEKVRRYLPLLKNPFSEDDCLRFLESKKRLWNEFGFGPWAIRVKGEFAGWGGLQKERDDVDFALVLHPEFWGWGLKIFKEIQQMAFDQMSLASITALLPQDRVNIRFLYRIGFVDDGVLVIEDTVFRRFRLINK